MDVTYGDRKPCKQSIVVIWDTIRRHIKFCVDGVDRGIAYANIPTQTPLVACVCMISLGDKVELICDDNNNK